MSSLAQLKAKAESMASRAMVFPQEPNFSAQAANRRPSFSSNHSGGSKRSKGSFGSANGGWKPGGGNAATTAKKVMRTRQTAPFNPKESKARMMAQDLKNMETEAALAALARAGSLDQNINEGLYGGLNEDQQAQIKEATDVIARIVQEGEKKKNAYTQYDKVNAGAVEQEYINSMRKVNRAEEFQTDVKLRRQKIEEKTEEEAKDFQKTGTFGVEKRFANTSQTVREGDPPYAEDGTNWPPQTTGEAADNEIMEKMAWGEEPYKKPKSCKPKDGSAIHLGDDQGDWPPQPESKEKQETVVMLQEQYPEKCKALKHKRLPGGTRLSNITLGGPYATCSWPPKTEYESATQAIRKAPYQAPTIEGPYDPYGKQQYFLQQTGAAGTSSKKLHMKGSRWMGRYTLVDAIMEQPKQAEPKYFPGVDIPKGQPQKQQKPKERTAADLIAETNAKLAPQEAEAELISRFDQLMQGDSSDQAPSRPSWDDVNRFS